MDERKTPFWLRSVRFVVSRIVMHGDNYDMDMVLDINCELYKVGVGTRLNVVLASSLNKDGTADEKYYNQVRAAFKWPPLRPALCAHSRRCAVVLLQSGEESLMDGYEYVMHGKVFKVAHKKTPTQDNLCVAFRLSHSDCSLLSVSPSFRPACGQRKQLASATAQPFCCCASQRGVCVVRRLVDELEGATHFFADHPCAKPCKRLTVIVVRAQGDPRNLQKIELDKRIYILMRQTS